jgi:hypothetical protein
MAIFRKESTSKPVRKSFALTPDNANELSLYARFLDNSTESWVLNQVLEVAFKKDAEFAAWKKEHASQHEAITKPPKPKKVDKKENPSDPPAAK